MSDRVPAALWLTLPIVVLGLATSAAGVFAAFPYAAETASWAAQGRGQDAVNLIVFPALAVAALLAARGALSAYLVWLGLVLYAAYSYLIYAGFVHFGPLFPLYIATFGCSAYALAWGLLVLDPAAVRARLGSAPARAAAILMLTVAVLFYGLDLSVDLGAIATGRVPDAMAEAGLVVDPVHILDMGLLLPAMVIAGVSILRGGPLGYLLAAPLLAFFGTLAIAIGAMFVSMWAAGLPIVWPMVAVFSLTAALSFWLLLRLLASLGATSIGDVLLRRR